MGVYSKRAFIVLSTQTPNYCTAAVITLFLAAATYSSQLKSLVVGVVFLPLCRYLSLGISLSAIINESLDLLCSDCLIQMDYEYTHQ